MMPAYRIVAFFTIWALLALFALFLNFMNIEWENTSLPAGITVLVLLFVIQGSLLELPLMTLCAILFWKEGKENKRKPAEHLSLVLNYNLLALCKDDIDECLQKMYEAYMGNLSENVSAVMISAAKEDELKKYELEVRDKFRAMIFDDLNREGLDYVNDNTSKVHPIRLKFIWSKKRRSDKRYFIENILPRICNRFSKDFMVIHRKCRVLRKCGQYQDLMLLSKSEDKAFTYTDRHLYSSYARNYNDPLFFESEDVENLKGRQFDYTLVLDSDTGVISGSAIKLLEIAAAHPEKGIIQPAIKLDCTASDTIFMHVERIRQSLHEPITNSFTTFMGQSSYFGKALIKNSVYIENVIGTRDNLIERVPVDVLSHDTFEAALLKPLYAGSVYLLEAPSYNYVAWNIRERRWNSGEVLLSMYFWKNAIGKPMRWIQSKLQGEKFNPTKVRTESKLDFVTSYIAHSALRQMFMKPLLLAYIIVNYQTHLRYRYASIIIVMFLVLVFPKFATCTRENYKFVFLETMASFLQFTPEAMVGCVRIVRAIQANISANVKWVPQRAVEEEFKNSNPFISSFKHLWGYSVFAVVCAVLVGFFASEALLILVMLVTLFLLPFYTGFTSLTPDFKSSKSVMENYKANVQTAVSTIAKPDHASTPGPKYAFTNIATAFSTHPDVNSRYKPFAFRDQYNIV